MAERIDHELTGAEDAALTEAAEQAMSHAGSAGGAIGGAIGGGGAGAAGGARGGASGGKWGVKLARVHSAAGVVEAPIEPEQALERARASIAEHGIEIEDPNAAADASVWAIVGSGSMNLNAALVRIESEPTSFGGSRTSIRASAREGRMGRKNTGTTAVDRLIAAIES